MEREFYTVDDLAGILKVCKTTILRYIKSKELNAIKLGKSYRIDKMDFDKFINTKKNA